MLQLTGIQKAFGSNQVLKNLDLTIHSGEFYSLLGPNGAGKSTTLNIIAQLLKPDGGTIQLNNLDPNTHSKQVKQMLGVVPQEIALYEELTAWENLFFWGGLNGVSKPVITEKGKTILTRFGLFDRKDEKIKTYSGGMKRRINIAVALLHDPQFILMDEPTVGIDPQSRNNIYEFMETLKQEGKTILYTTHYMEEAERFSSRIGIIDDGRIVRSGTFEEIKKGLALPAKIQVVFEGNPGNRLKQFQIENPNQNIVLTDKELTLDTTDFRNDLKTIVLLFSECNADILHIEKKDVNLETIFLKLTGKNLRD